MVCGFYVHLLTDYFWNDTSYKKYFRNHNGLVEIQLIDGTTEDYMLKSKIQLSNKNYKIFTQDILNEYFDESIDFIIQKLKMNF